MSDSNKPRTLADRGYGMVYCLDSTRKKIRKIAAFLDKPMYEISDRYITAQVERDYAKLFPNGEPKAQFRRQSRKAA